MGGNVSPPTTIIIFVAVEIIWRSKSTVFRLFTLYKVKVLLKGSHSETTVFGNKWFTEVENAKPPAEGSNTKAETLQEQQITTFQEASEVQVGNKPQMTKAHLKWLRDVAGVKEARNHSLLDFLKRPRPIEKVTWTTSSTAGSTLWSSQLPNAVLSSPMINCKTNDFAFFRADIHVRFQLNANKFALGCLLANYHPMPTVSDASTDDVNLCTATCYPYALIEASSAATVDLMIPFTYNNAMWDMVNDQAVPWADVEIVVLNPLQVTQGSSAIEVQVWMWCENIHLEVPVPNIIPVYTPSQFVGKSESKQAAKSGSILGIASKAIGGVTDVMNSIGAAANWVEDLGGLEMLGLSKPSNFETSTEVSQVPAKGMASFNGVDSSSMLAANTKNSVSNKNEVFGFAQDQMDITYAVSTPCFLETFTWALSDASGKVLWSIPVAPGVCFPGSSTSNVHPGIMAYITSMFSLWRGDISYKFHVVANAFYSGRLAIVYLPRKTTIGATVSYGDIDAAVQVIVDIRDSTVVCYTAKWAVNEPWLRARVASRTSVNTTMTYADINNINASAGLLACYVLTPLVAPESVPLTIPVNVFTYGDKSLQFAAPLCENYMPMPSYTPSAVLAHRPWTTPIKPTVMREKQKRTKAKVAHYVGKTSLDETPKIQTDPGLHGAHIEPIKGLLTPFDHEICAMTIGEMITNLRQLCRCFSEIASVSITAMDTDYVVLDPAYFGWSISDTLYPRFCRIARMFTYWRGSMRWKIVPQVPDTVSYPTFEVTTDYLQTGNALAPAVVTYNQNNVGFPWFVNVQQTPVIEVATPYYSRNLVSVVTPTNNVDRQRIMFTQGFAETVPSTIFAATGDDHSFGFLKAPPRLTTYT